MVRHRLKWNGLKRGNDGTKLKQVLLEALGSSGLQDANTGSSFLLLFVRCNKK